MNAIIKTIMKTALTPYIKYKVNDMILEEVKAMNDENYSSQYFDQQHSLVVDYYFSHYYYF